MRSSNIFRPSAAFSIQCDLSFDHLDCSRLQWWYASVCTKTVLQGSVRIGTASFVSVCYPWWATIRVDRSLLPVGFVQPTYKRVGISTATRATARATRKRSRLAGLGVASTVAIRPRLAVSAIYLLDSEKNMNFVIPIENSLLLKR